MTNAEQEIHFPKLHHFWMDAGLIGFYELTKQEHPEQWDVSLLLDDAGVTLRGTEGNLQSLLKHAYTVLLNRYYDTSSEGQRADNAGFYYDTAQDAFIRFPKVKPRGIAALIFDKAPRPTKGAVKYADKKRGLLPPELAHLQERFNAFLQENSLKIEMSNLLIDGPNAHQPHVLVLDRKVLIPPKKAKSKGNCFICGQEGHALTEVGSTVFPLITGKDGVLSFNSTCSNPAKVCWKCDYIGKFVPVSGFYATSDGICHMYFPYSSSLEKMHEVFRPLEAIKAADPNYFRNFNQDLGGYFQKPYEMLLSFLYSVYRRALGSNEPSDQEDEEPGFDFAKFYQITTAHAPLEFVVMYTEPLGKTQMAKMVWPFKRSVYVFRLFDNLERKGIRLRDVMRELVDFEQDKNEYKTLMRNRVCERILNQQSVVDLVEQHVFHVNKSKVQYIKPLHDFTIEYEKILNEEKRPMHQELIDAAVSLGKTIGMSVAPSGKKGKGDLFRLRKARKAEDFLNEINRIQIKHGALVTSDLYNKGEAFGDNFSEFKQFCMIAALNTFNGQNRERENAGAQNDTTGETA